MNYMGHLCREAYEQERLTQRQLAERLGISLGKCNSLVHEGVELGYLQADNGNTAITPAGVAYLEQFRVKNAIIHAAGIDVRFVPYIHELPKSLLEVEDERLVERIIRQLNEKGIFDITVLVGYMAEKMEYLTDKYGVKLLFNPDYATKSNLTGIYLTRKLMGNTYLINADAWVAENLFHEFEPESWIACHHSNNMTDEWCLTIDGKRRIRTMQQGGQDMLVKRGPVYIDEETARKLEPILVRAHAMPGMAVLRWEYTLMQHLDTLALYANIQPPNMVQDFANMEDLRQFESNGTSARVDEVVRSIAFHFGTTRENVSDVRWLRVSAANRVFSFCVDGAGYVCRVPHNATARFTTYRQEALVYKALQPLHVTEEILHYDAESGIKLSSYYPLAEEMRNGGMENIREVLALLRCIHQSGVRVRHHFSIGQTLRQYDVLCRRENCVLFEDYDAVWYALNEPLEDIELAGGETVLCHINAEMFDIIRAPDGGLRLANWEYSGMCHPLADVAMAALFFGVQPQGLAGLLECYLERPATADETHLCQCYAAAGGILWSLYGEHCQHEGDDFGEYAVRMYQLGKCYLRVLGCL